MLIHLESGACSSRVDKEQIDWWMRNAYSCRKYVRYGGLPLSYVCPGCDRDFNRLSGLLQHIESNSCQEDIDSAMLALRRELEPLVLDHCSS